MDGEKDLTKFNNLSQLKQEKKKTFNKLGIEGNAW